MNKNIVSYFAALFFAIQVGGEIKAQEQIHLFPDKSYAVSGDTLWFSIFIYSENQDQASQVVHVQLDDMANNHILKVSILCNGAFGEGYIPIPDSLSTGLYSLNPFSLKQKNSKSADINQKYINVYNRFNIDIASIHKPDELLKTYALESGITIKTDKENYKRGEKVLVSYNIPQEKLDEYQKILITAGVADPISEPYLSFAAKVQTIHNPAIPVPLAEKNGILISGKVTESETRTPVPNAIVLLSIPDSIPFFDYCVSDENGAFYFYLRNAVGTADLIFQALTKNNLDCRIELSESYLDVQNIHLSENILTHAEEGFTANILKASHFDKLFRGYEISGSNYFSKPLQFDHPFYGEPTKTFDPNEFIDLPDFQEISVEILHGVIYREKKDGITIRVLNHGGKTVFEDEPLRLLDGIPVFNNEVFKPMNTADILKVDVVFYERFYGDLSFHGVLSVYTKKRSLDWIDKDPKIGHFKYDCMQPPRKYDFQNGLMPNKNIPNMNKVLYRGSGNHAPANNTFSFFTSDITGEVEIRMIFIDKNNQVLYCHKLINVE